MQEEQNTISILDYLDVALRRKWFVIIPFIAVLLGTVMLCFILPKVYKASTTILVIPQNVPDEFVKTTVTMNPSEYLNVLSQEIMSRTRLEHVITDLALFPELIHKVPLDDIIDRMRDNIEIDIKTRSNQGGGAASFTISYLGIDPNTVASIANRLASLFIEENLKSREQQARKTKEFLTNELTELEKTLAAHEKIISDFKQRNIGSLPEQRDANLRMLDQLLMQRQRVADELSDLENRRMLMQQPPGSLSSGQAGNGAIPAAPLETRISDAERRLAALQNRYTDSHPDVIRAKAELEKMRRMESGASADPDAPAQAAAGDTLDQQALALNFSRAALHNEETAIKAKIADYQARVEMAPRLEQELTALSRDYQNTRKAYDELLTKRLEAEQAEKLEIDRRGEQFKVLDVAKVPTKPFKPDMLKIALMGLLLAFAAGGATAFTAEYLDQSFHSVKDLESYLELPVLASLPEFPDKKKRTVQAG